MLRITVIPMKVTSVRNVRNAVVLSAHTVKYGFSNTAPCFQKPAFFCGPKQRLKSRIKSQKIINKQCNLSDADELNGAESILRD
jgi:hypothetical protein